MRGFQNVGIEGASQTFIACDHDQQNPIFRPLDQQWMLRLPVSGS